jgi:hypothetical protein
MGRAATYRIQHAGPTRNPISPTAFAKVSRLRGKTKATREYATATTKPPWAAESTDTDSPRERARQAPTAAETKLLGTSTTKELARRSNIGDTCSGGTGTNTYTTSRKNAENPNGTAAAHAAAGTRIANVALIGRGLLPPESINNGSVLVTWRVCV